MKLNFREEFPNLGNALRPQADFAPVSDDFGEAAEQALSVSAAGELAAFYMEALDSAAMVEISDPLGTILSVNDRFCTITGYSRGELVGANHRLLSSGEHDREFFQCMRLTIARGEVWRGQICNRTKAGEPLWLDTTIVPHRRRDGSIERFIAVRFDITAQKQAEARLRRLANVDALTDLPNRHSFLQALEEVIAGTRPSRGRVAVGILDLDKFKDINDSLGHEAGDMLLREVALRLRMAIGRNDELARLGGDEFGLVLRDCASDAELKERIDRIFATFAAPMPVNGTERVLTASIGLAMVPLYDGNCGDLLKNADIALHEAKANGRGRTELFCDAMDDQVRRRAGLCDAFERGLRAREFVVYFQPIAPLDGVSPLSMEALLRWNHPQFGLITPPHFIDALADEQLAAQVGAYVLDTVLGQIRCWRRAGVPFGSIAVNATLGDFRSGRYVDTILAAIASGAIVPGDISVEINEDVLMERGGGDCARAEIERLHQAGIAIAFDDFGTGFASLRHLRDLPIDIVKIDKGFIRAIADPDEEAGADRAIVGNVIELAHQLGKTVTAEGVETLEQARVLKDLNCDRIQGFLLARAITPEEIEPILLSSDRVAGLLG